MRTAICTLLILVSSGCMSLPQKNAALLRYSAAGETDKVKEMLDKGADINARTRYGDTALHLAIRNAHASTSTLLIEKGVNINAAGALGDTPLHISVYTGQREVSSVLRQRGADETRPNTYGLFPREMETVPDFEKKIVQAAELLRIDGTWIDIRGAQKLYEELRRLESRYVTNSVVLQVIRNSLMRLRVLLLAIKLGIQGSEEKLANLLMVYGDKPMAEDYLNCGSAVLDSAARAWASANGYKILTGPGSHRASWGRF